MNWASVARAFFIMLGGVAACAFAAAPFAVDAAERQAFLAGGAFDALIAAAGFAATPRFAPGTTRFREGMMVAFALWLGAPVFAAAPIALAGAPPGAAYFDAVSAVTTTGLWRDAGAVHASPAQAMFRALLSWSGGFASLVVMSAVLLRREFGGVRISAPALFGAGEEGVAPAMARLARGFSGPYLALTAIGIAALAFSGAAPLDAVLFALGAVSTGGGAASAESLAGANGATLAIVAVLSALGAVSFFVVAVAANLKRPRIDEETGAFLAILPPFALLLFATGGVGLGAAAFDAVSILSTNGALLGEPEFSVAALVGACVGGSVVSTAGGLKLARWLTVFRRARRELRRLAHPRAVQPAPRNSDTLGVWIHFAAFTIVLAVLVLATAKAGLALPEAATFAVAAFANAGPLVGLGDAATDAGGVGPAASAFLVAGMALGRLDAVAAIAILNRGFWRS